MNNITALIMAAGTDDKMKSKKSKLAQTIYGKEVIKRVVNSVKKAGIEEVGVIVGENKGADTYRIIGATDTNTHDAQH